MKTTNVTRNFDTPPDERVTQMAACQSPEVDGWLFFTQGREAQAITICNSCPVRSACLREALSCGTRLYGVWGGTTQRQRRRMQHMV